MAEIWTSQISIDLPEKLVRIRADNIMRMDEFRKEVKNKSEEWKKFCQLLYDLQHPRDYNYSGVVKAPYPSRIGGGIALIAEIDKVPYYVFLLRDKDAPSYPLSLDIAAGRVEPTEREMANKRILYPQIYRLLIEMNSEIAFVQEGDKKRVMYVPVPKNTEEELKTLMTYTAISNISLLPRDRDSKSTALAITENLEIGEFEDGFYLEEELPYDTANKRCGVIRISKPVIRCEGVSVTAEPQNGSIELIFPAFIRLDSKDENVVLDVQSREYKPVGYEIVPCDVEIMGEIDRYERTIILNPNKVTPLDRYVVLIPAEDYNSNIRVYKSGDLKYEGDYNTFFSEIGLIEAIKDGKTTGATSKVVELSREEGIKFTDKQFSTTPIRKILEELFAIRPS